MARGPSATRNPPHVVTDPRWALPRGRPRAPSRGSGTLRCPGTRSVTDPGVQERVGEVHGEADGAEEHHVDEHDRLDHHVVALQDRVHGHAGHARYVEDHLYHEAAGDGVPEGHAE